ncbi:carbohydrate ABC transporter permease [Microbacterium immunditiarum]|uniref:Multiple sugar transport system permease protein n=1 Tax=Microbacterium immunditiarum TaxID=337480 RepID=A0A7Y9GS07_9MICO|nr:sugar ABC transporter permease [Microbacterium immunditiarum]NYE21568.1 multiple sugar transport system permease protein [Microbacterium immunditiarum]
MSLTKAARPTEAPTVGAEGAAQPELRGTPRRRRGWRRKAAPYLFLILPLALLLVFTYWPVLNMFYYSVTDWDGLDKTKNFVGLDNYTETFTEPDNLRVFLVSLYYFVAALAQMAIALYFAVLLSFRVRFKNLWKGILFFPYLINGVAIGMIFLNFLKPDGGLDTVLSLLGFDSLIRQWTGDPAIINITLASVAVWRYMGLNFVMFLGAIQSIPRETFEAAALDGANRWHEVRYIILPSIRPIVGLQFILAISGALAVFEVPYIMTGGGNGSETFVIRTIWTAFQRNMVGLASAMAVIMLLIVLIMTWIQRAVMPERKVDLA